MLQSPCATKMKPKTIVGTKNWILSSILIRFRMLVYDILKQYFCVSIQVVDGFKLVMSLLWTCVYESSLKYFHISRERPRIINHARDGSFLPTFDVIFESPEGDLLRYVLFKSPQKKPEKAKSRFHQTFAEIEKRYFVYAWRCWQQMTDRL